MKIMKIMFRERVSGGGGDDGEDVLYIYDVVYAVGGVLWCGVVSLVK